MKQLETNANFNFDEHYLECKIISNRYIKKKLTEVNAIGMSLVRNLQNFSLT